MHETFDHTADLGLRIRTNDLETLFVESAEALFSVIVEDLSTVKPVQEIAIHLSEEDREYLLFDWLKNLLIYFDADDLLLSKFEVTIKDNELSAKVWGEPLDRSRHELAHEVKAITYHGLLVEQTEEGWLAEVIVDI